MSDVGWDEAPPEPQIGALPVVEAQRVVGILTQTDVLRAFLKAQVALPVAA